MAKKGRKFEKEYAWLYGLNKEYNVTTPAYLYDKIAKIDREVDVLLEFYDKNGIKRSIAVETRDRNKKQDVMWPEQLIIKKNDIGVDYLISVSNYGFSKAAINKAKHYGVIIEKAKVFDKKTLDSIKKEFFMDVYYIIPKVEELNILFDNNKIKSIKEFYNELNVIEKQEFLNELNYNLFLGIDYYSLINKYIDISNFYNIKGDTSIEISKSVNADKQYNIFAIKQNIKSIYFKIRIVPYKLTLFLNNSISIFNPENNSNLKYRAVFGTKDDNISISYINSKEINTEHNLKRRKYFKCIGGSAHINTIFNSNSVINLNPEELIDSIKTEFDYSDVL